MKKMSLSHTVILAAALAAGGIAHAQTRAAETTNVPQRAGEASTMTGGAPNAVTSNPTTTTRPAHMNMGKTGETSNVPLRAGEASTMTGGAPNAKTTNSPGTTTSKKTAKTSKMGNTGHAGAMHDKSDMGGKASATETSKVPQRAGEASTMTNGVPNARIAN